MVVVIAVVVPEVGGVKQMACVDPFPEVRLRTFIPG